MDDEFKDLDMDVRRSVTSARIDLRMIAFPNVRFKTASDNQRSGKNKSNVDNDTLNRDAGTES